MNSVRINSNLVVDKEFFNFLTSTNNIISNVILNGDTEKGINYIKPIDSETISYLSDEKKKDGINPFTQSNRIKIRIGRLISKLISNYITELNISNSHIESFVNHYKSWFDTSCLEYRIVEGEEIKKWYLDRNYFTLGGYPSGTLWNSCMRYQERQSFLELYTINKDIKMLILTTKVDDEEKLRARAILWNNVIVTESQEDLGQSIKVMDRIYSVFDSDVILLKRWAEQNGYICKWEQNAKSHQYFDIKNNPIKIKCQIHLDKFILKYYPYLDTFPFFDRTNGVITNNEYNRYWEYKLVQANGSLLPSEPEPEYDEEFDED